MKIALITSTRAEYGLLKPLIQRLQKDDFFDLKIIATGAHLCPEQGLTYKEIEKDGVHIDQKFEINLNSDTNVSMTKAVGLAILSFADYFSNQRPDGVILLGDRYEIFACAIAAALTQIPIFHLHGGELTEGLIDEFIRHSITKMSYLHFTACEEYRKRVIQLGESPNRVYNVGALGVENIKTLPLLSKVDLEEQIGFSLERPYALVTFHPVTLENHTQGEQLRTVFQALDAFPQLRFIFTKSNADSGGLEINQLIDNYVALNPERSIAFFSMGYLRYLSAMQHCAMVIGNSSSGILEAPASKVPTIDIGDRQKGRLAAPSVIHCDVDKQSIIEAMQKAFSIDFQQFCKLVENPFGDGNTSEKIVAVIKKKFKEGISLKKAFFDVNFTY